MAIWSAQDAKNHFSAMVDAAGREPQTVTRYGKPAVVVIDAREYERLKRLEERPSPNFADHLLAMPSGADLFDRLDGRLRDHEF